MVILDTSVVSELMRPTPAPRVAAWLAQQDGGQAYLTAITEAELRTAVAITTDGKRRDDLAQAIDGILREDFRAPILPFDSSAASAHATIAAARRAACRPISQFDCQIAAIGRVHAATVATRNAKDFEECGIDVVNPWAVR